MFRGLKIARVCYLLQCFGVGPQRYEIFVVESCFAKVVCDLRGSSDGYGIAGLADSHSCLS